MRIVRRFAKHRSFIRMNVVMHGQCCRMMLHFRRGVSLPVQRNHPSTRRHFKLRTRCACGVKSRPAWCLVIVSEVARHHAATTGGHAKV